MCKKFKPRRKIIYDTIKRPNTYLLLKLYPYKTVPQTYEIQFKI